MTEPGVTLTDYAVALEAVVLGFLVWRSQQPGGGLRFWLTLLFASVSVASLCGGTVHGFILDERTLGYTILWPATLLAMGVTALSMWAIGARLLFSRRVARWMLAGAAVQFALYSFVVLFRSQEFWIGITDNLPAILLLALALGLTFRREGPGSLALALGGPAMVLLAALLQQLRVGIDPVYFNHNALYHVLQAIALWLLFLVGRRLLATQSGQPETRLPEPDFSDVGATNDGPIRAI